MAFSALPPEVNSTRIYSGPGSGPLLAAATAWSQLAAELRSTAATYSSAVSTLTSQGWHGPASMSMASAVAPYIQWLTTTATHAEQTAAQAAAAANAYNQAFAMTVPPVAVTANRSQLASLAATNILGQNTPAIAANEAHYGEMWAQDATAMESYSAQSTAASALPAFTPPAQDTGLVDDDTADTFLSLTLIRTVLAAFRTVALDELAVVASLSGLGSFLVADAAFSRTVMKEDGGVNGEPPQRGTILVGEGEGGAVMPAAGLGFRNGGSAVSAMAGRASMAGALSVPQAWSTPPEIRQLARALPLTTTPHAAGPAAEENPYTGLGMAGMAGGGMGGLAGLGAAAGANSSSTPPSTPNVAAQRPPKPAAKTPAASAATPVTLSSENVAENLAKTLAAMPGATVVVIPATAPPQ